LSALADFESDRAVGPRYGIGLLGSSIREKYEILRQ